jgi:hypothetical protein
MAGKSADTQWRSSRFTLGEVIWKSNRVVSRGQVTAPPPENRVSGSEPREVEDRAVAVQPHPSHRVGERHRRIAHPGGQRVDVDRERLPVGCRDPELRKPRVEVRQHDHPPEAVGALFDHPSRLGPLRGQGRIALGLGPERAVRIPRQRDAQGAGGDLHLVEVDQRRGPAARPLLEAQHLLVVHPAVAQLDELDGGMIEGHAAQQYLLGEQVGQPVGHPHPRQVGQQRARGVAHHQVFQGEVVQERARDGAHLDLADQDPVQRGGHRAREQVPSRRRERHRRHHAQHHGDDAEQEDEEEPRHAPPHQNACPTATWKVNLLPRSLT